MNEYWCNTTPALEPDPKPILPANFEHWDQLYGSDGDGIEYNKTQSVSDEEKKKENISPKETAKATNTTQAKEEVKGTTAKEVAKTTTTKKAAKGTKVKETKAKENEVFSFDLLHTS